MVNFMHLGWSEPSTLESKLCREYTPAQRSAFEHFGEQVDYFLKDDKPLPGIDWDLLLAAKAVDYNQDLAHSSTAPSSDTEGSEAHPDAGAADEENGDAADACCPPDARGAAGTGHEGHAGKRLRASRCRMCSRLPAGARG